MYDIMFSEVREAGRKLRFSIVGPVLFRGYRLFCAFLLMNGLLLATHQRALIYKINNELQNHLYTYFIYDILLNGCDIYFPSPRGPVSFMIWSFYFCPSLSEAVRSCPRGSV